MVTGDPVDLNLTMSPSSRKIPALLAKNSAQPCQIESCGEIMWIRVRPIDDDDEDSGKQGEGKTFHKFHVIGMNDDLWDKFRGLSSEIWKGCE